MVSSSSTSKIDDKENGAAVDLSNPFTWINDVPYINGKKLSVVQFRSIQNVLYKNNGTLPSQLYLKRMRNFATLSMI